MLQQWRERETGKNRTAEAFGPILKRTGWSLALVVLGGCGGTLLDGDGATDDGGGGGGGGEQPDGDDDPGGGNELPDYEMSAGATVAQLETVLPSGASFVLHGTVPVPPGIVMPDADTLPIAILDADGTPVPTQAEIVSRYAKDADGADVVELLARVNVPEGAAPGDRATYAVTALATPIPRIQPDEQAIEALIEGPAGISNNVSNLLTSGSGIFLNSSDVHGHPYKVNLVDPASATKVTKYGLAKAEVRTYSPMVPITPVAGANGTLPHLFGVHAYLETTANEEIVLLDLRLNNGPANTVPGSDLDDVVNRIYFGEIELDLPSGWTALQAFPDPAMGDTYSVGGRNHIPLVAPLAGGDKHMMPMQGQMVRRLAICRTDAIDRAIEMLAAEGLAFCVPAMDVQTGQDTWSWQNQITARYLAQSFQLPSLEHLGLGNVRNQLNDQFLATKNVFDAGTNTGDYPIKSSRLGWAHPYGVPYGGMTSGFEIHLFEGVDTVAARSIEGYRHYELLHRMHTDRQPNALWRLDGEPANFLDWFVQQGEAGETSYVPLNYYMKLINGNDPIGIKSPPSAQTDAAANLGLEPDYQDALLGFDSHDLQHLIRYTRSPKALAWIGNDTIAKDDLLLQAELVRLSYHPFYNNAYGNKMSTGMRTDIDDTVNYPGEGIDFGRGEAWGTDTTVAAYRLSDPARRQVEQAILEREAEMLADSQIACSGYIMSKTAPKILLGKYKGAQAYEVSIVGNAIRGLNESVLRGNSLSKAAMIDDVLRAHYLGFISPLSWSSTQNGPWEMFATAPNGTTSEPYCVQGDQPSDGVTTGVNKYQTWSTLGFAYDLTEDGQFLDRAEDMIGGDLLTELLADGIDNIQNRAALLTVVQRLADML